MKNEKRKKKRIEEENNTEIWEYKKVTTDKICSPMTWVMVLEELPSCISYHAVGNLLSF